MDLGKYDTSVKEEEGAFLHLEGPNGDKLWSDEEPREPVGITLLGIHSKKLKDLEHKQQNKRLASTRMGKRGQIRGVTSEQVEENASEMFVAATVSFKHIMVDGDTWQADRAAELYDRFAWIRAQVDEFINTEANFLGEA
jgi:hypothetical protein